MAIDLLKVNPNKISKGIKNTPPPIPRRPDKNPTIIPNKIDHFSLGL